jgi:hypothetical protein
MTAFTLEDLHGMAAGLIGRHLDVACPECGPYRRAPKNRTRKVLRIWTIDENFATWCCARCGIKGEAHSGHGERRRIDPEALARARAAASVREREAVAAQLGKARWFWGGARDPRGTVVETYLREVRRYGSRRIPATIRYLPPRGDHGAAMVAAYGMAEEPEPGLLTIRDDQVRGIQFTNLTPHGQKVPDDAKISLGRTAGWPIVLAPLNDSLGLAITEGAEDALSIHAATGLGAWCSGGASRLPALADAVPSYCDCVTVVVDDDRDGRRHGAELGARLRGRCLNVEMLDMGKAA